MVTIIEILQITLFSSKAPSRFTQNEFTLYFSYCTGSRIIFFFSLECNRVSLVQMYMEAFQATQNANQGRRRSRSKKSSITAPRVNIIKPVNEKNIASLRFLDDRTTKEEGVPTQLPSVGEDVEIAPRLPDEAAEMELNDAQDSEKDLETMQTAVK